MLFMIRRLTLVKSHLKIITALSIFTVFWAVAGMFAYAFQCGLPRPWHYTGGQCANGVSLSPPPLLPSKAARRHYLAGIPSRRDSWCIIC